MDASLKKSSPSDVFNGIVCSRDPRFKEHLQQQAEQHMLNQNPELAENEALYEQEKRRIKQDMGSLGCKNLFLLLLVNVEILVAIAHTHPTCSNK